VETFLKEASKKIIESGYSIEDSIIILPNKRAGLFLLDTLSKLVNKSIIAPEIFSIEEFIIKLSGKIKASKLELIIEFYKVYTLNTPSAERDSFEDFLSWSPALLKDFNEIDSYLVDSKELFNSLISYEELESWNKDKSSKNKFKSKFWKRLPVYYIELKKTLLESEAGSVGMLYREAVDALNIYIESSDKHHFFIGFNALNKSENIIFQEFLESGKATILWDLDIYFFEDKNHSSSNFIRSYLSNWKYYRNNKNYLFSDNYRFSKNIEIIGLPQNVAQAKFVGKKIKKITGNNHNINTAVILGNEELLVPTLSGLPENIKDWNATMGYPLSKTIMSTFFQIFFDFHNSFKDGLFYYENLLNLLNIDWIKDLFKNDDFKVEELIHTIKNNNWEYINYNELFIYNKINNSYLSKLFFSPFSTANQFIDRCLKIIEVTSSHSKKKSLEESKINIRYSNEFETIFKKLKNLNHQNNSFDSINTLKYFFNELIIKYKINFTGSPLKGIQIMGLLESRVLDFENVIITNLNEGILPMGKNDFSFFPFELKKYFGLPTFHENDAIYTYHFYRLLQRAKNIILLYNTQNDGLHRGEKSRFIYQLEHDGLVTHNLNITNKFPKVYPQIEKRTEIKKSNQIIEVLIKIAQKGFSASSISQYLHNPIEFYNQRILNIKESEKLDISLNFLDRGTIVHNTLEELYLPYKNNFLNIDNLNTIISKIESTLLDNFKKIFNGSLLINGRNQLLLSTLKKTISDHFLTERKQILEGHSLKIIEIEKYFNYELNFSNFLFPIKLVGKIDRIDIFDGEIRIIDYKTGSIQLKDLILKDFNQLRNDFKMGPMFQLLLYSYICKNMFEENSKITSGIISFRNPKASIMPLKLNFKNELQNYLDIELFLEFELFLKSIFTELFDVKNPFVL